MRESPRDGLFSARFILGRGVVQSQFEAALWRIRRGLDAGFEILPACGLTVAIALQPFRALRG